MDYLEKYEAEQEARREFLDRQAMPQQAESIKPGVPHTITSEADLTLLAILDDRERLNSAIMRLVELREEIELEERRRVQDIIQERPVRVYGIYVS